MHNRIMGTVRLPSEEEIVAAYEQGQEVVIALFHSALEQMANRIQALEDQIAKNSRNSGKPHRAMDIVDQLRRVCANGMARKVVGKQGMSGTR